jgi:hypothetical protein
LLKCIFVININTDDKDRKKVNLDKLKNGLQDFHCDKDKEELFMILAKYIRKTHSDSEIKQELKSNEGMLFVDLITPSDIAFVISVIKNADWVNHKMMVELRLRYNHYLQREQVRKRSKGGVSGVTRECGTTNALKRYGRRYTKMKQLW